VGAYGQRLRAALNDFQDEVGLAEKEAADLAGVSVPVMVRHYRRRTSETDATVKGNFDSAAPRLAPGREEKGGARAAGAQEVGPPA
jgi:hypothetical protein